MSKLKFMKIFRRTLTKHSLISVFFLLLLLRKEKQKINLSFFVKFWCSVDENSNITCSATDDKFSILYYFNSKHLDLDYLLSLLNTFVREQQLVDSKVNLFVKDLKLKERFQNYQNVVILYKLFQRTIC